MSDDTTETLRRAAKLMRENAGAATPGPWRAVAGTFGGEEFAAVVSPDGYPGDAETWLMATGNGAVSQKADARHAAFMHPGVALAVAEWLAFEAVSAPGEDELYVRGGRTELAMNIARAYLGEAA